MKRELKLQPGEAPILHKHCRAYPDEKGIETGEMYREEAAEKLKIAEPIPMKRELKLISTLTPNTSRASLQSLSR